MESAGSPVGSELQMHADDVEAVLVTSFVEDDGDEGLTARDSAAIELGDAGVVDELEVDCPIVGDAKTEPSVGMMFQSAVAAYRLYIEYGRSVGFAVRKKYCRRSKTNNEMIAGWYVCTREGKSAPREKTEGSKASRRKGCRASMKVKRMSNKEWKVVHFFKDHNHELDPESVSLVRYRMKNQAPRKGRINVVHGVTCGDKTAGSDEQSVSNDGEHINFTDKMRHRFFPPVDAHAIHMLFMHMHPKNPAFFYAVEFDGEQRLKNVFWADAKSKVAYTHFGDVVTIDTTYLTYGYKVPFAPFVGVNHHGQPVLLGCALLADESTASFVWLFKTWLGAMSGRPPNAIITAYNKDIAAAVVQVFPKSHHRFCLWHIVQRVPEKLGDVCEARENFLKKLYKCIYDSTSDGEFEKRWWKLILRFGLSNEEWIHSLYNDKRKWVPLFLKDTFFAGMSISQQDESIHCMFDKYINRETSLKEFIEKYESALESRFEDEAQEDFRSLHSKPKERTHLSPFEFQLATVYTRNMFEKFQSEILGISSVSASKSEENRNITTYKVKAYEIKGYKNRRVVEKDYEVLWNATERKISCVCRLFEFKGYLCRHALAVFLALGIVEIPSCYILKRWTVDAKSRNVLDGGYTEHGACPESAALRFNDICARSFKFAEEAALSKQSYDVALLALQEALRKVTNANDTDGRTGRRNYSHSGNNYKPSEISQFNYMGSMSCLSAPHVYASGWPNNWNGTSKQKSDLCENSEPLGYSPSWVHLSSGAQLLIDGCETLGDNNQETIHPYDN